MKYSAERFSILWYKIKRHIFNTYTINKAGKLRFTATHEARTQTIFAVEKQ